MNSSAVGQGWLTENTQCLDSLTMSNWIPTAGCPLSNIS